MASPDRASIALNELEATIGSILMQTGSAFAEASKSDVVRLSRTATRVRQFAPKAVDSVHDQLDILELQLQNAQFLLGQGLAATKAKALGITTAEQPSTEPTSIPITKNEKETVEDAIVTKEDPMDDIFMDDDLFKSPVDAAKPEVGTQPAQAQAQVAPEGPGEQKPEVSGEAPSAVNETKEEPPNATESNQQGDAMDLEKQAGGDAGPAEDERPENGPSKIDDNSASGLEQSQLGPPKNEAMNLNNDDANLLSGIEDYASDSGMAGFEGMSSFEDINNSNFESQDDLLNGNLGVDFAEDLQNNSEFESLFSLDNFGGASGEGQTNFDDIQFDDNFFNLDGS